MTTKPKSLITTLKLPRSALSTFPHDLSPIPSQANSSPSDTPAPHIIEPTPADTPADSTVAMNGASTPSSLAPPSNKRKGPKPGTKRSAAVMEAGNGSPAPKNARGKPGPKKKKLGDMLNDPNEKAPFAASAAIPKLGPKANQGAINAGLRALDRKGKFKCRKWEKKGFKVRSFTGVVFDLPSWKAPPRAAAFADDVKSDSTGSSESKLKDESSAISEKSGLNGDGSTLAPTPLNGLASSPAPIPAA